MSSRTGPSGGASVLEHQDFDLLLAELARQGYQVVGPTVQQGAIVYDRISSVSDMPAGWTDRQEAGSYRLERRDDGALFSYAVGPHSWKKLLFPPQLMLWRATRRDDGFEVEAGEASAPRYAFIGVRSCELHAIAIQDRVFLQGKYADAHYKGRREGAFIVAVNCTQAGGTCFCVSMNTGPRATQGYDLALTEVMEAGGAGYFLVEVGTEKGEQVLERLAHREASTEEETEARRRVNRAASSMGRSMETSDIKELLYSSYEHPRWDNVASRCLSCANCTLVCPTCFCSTTSDTTDLSGQQAERWRRWDSCFTLDFSYIHGGSVRASARSRYRQWMTHKLATWIDQFGTSGCVGCGRCITWCPVGIDITEEVSAIRQSKGAPSGPPGKEPP